MKHSLHNGNTNLGEALNIFYAHVQIHYCLKWFENVNILFKKIDVYANPKFDTEVYYVNLCPLSIGKTRI